MTTAALGAEVLDRCLRRSRAPQAIRSGTSLKFQRELARMIATPWLLATGSDYRYRRTEGPPRRRSSQMMHRYVDALTRLSTRNAGVRRRLLGVFHLLHPPAALFGAGVLGPLVWDWLTDGATEYDPPAQGNTDRGTAGSRPTRDGPVTAEMNLLEAERGGRWSR